MKNVVARWKSKWILSRYFGFSYKRKHVVLYSLLSNCKRHMYTVSCQKDNFLLTSFNIYCVVSVDCLVWNCRHYENIYTFWTLYRLESVIYWYMCYVSEILYYVTGWGLAGYLCLHLLNSFILSLRTGNGLKNWD